VVAPLQGIRVIEVANYVAAPSAGMLLRDLGADVVKVEPVGGEAMRGTAAARSPASSPNILFELENRGKRSVGIDLDDPAGVEMVHRLLGSADVMLTNLIAPRLERFRLTPDEVHAVNARLVFVALTGYGITGPDAGRPAFDYSAFWARSGIMGVVGHPGQPPVLSRIAQGDHTAGLNAALATLAALRVRDQTGAAQVVDVSLQNTGVFTIATDIALALVAPAQPARMDREAPTNPLFNSYRTRDGRWIMLVHMTPDRYWPRLCEMLGEDGWAADPHYASLAGRAEHGAEIAAGITAHFARHDLEYWAGALDAHGLIWAPMAELPEVVADPQLEAMEAFDEIETPDGPLRTVGVPFRIEGADVKARGRAPFAGEHTFEELRGAGFRDDELAELAKRGVIG
jgi:crotonobetainyl-CoA:carnitine CoA-transferase CaiB-like acyl-CoA transferase